MCRLYGFLANESTKVECSLVHAQNALLMQSVKDGRGVPNADGWGISYYVDNVVHVERRHTAANADRHFSLAAERVYARLVIAHVRAVTVGETGLANTHPFVYRHWTFAHNGTVHGFEHLAARIAQETDADLRALRLGNTDSEAAYYWLLTRMRHAGINIEDPNVALEHLVEVVRTSVARLDALCAEVSPDTPAQLNFLLTNGSVLLATRLRNSLFYVERRGLHDCEICGIPHVHHDDKTLYRAVVVASEAISHEPWQEVPDGSIVVVDDNLAATVCPL